MVEKKLAKEIVQQLSSLYSQGKGDCPDAVLQGYPDPQNIIAGLRRLFEVLFPGINAARLGDLELDNYLAIGLEESYHFLRPEIENALPFRWGADAAKLESSDFVRESQEITEAFLSRMPHIRGMLIDDVQAAYDGDPAALSYAEVILAYPGLVAITSHRIAHELYELNVPVVPRIMSEWTHTKTGCDIHPGAKIGKGFFVDHPTGVVIGETAEIGEHVKFYQGVTIGAKSFPLDEDGKPIKHIKRHPTVENDVIVYSNATILGGDTVIGAGTTIGGNVFVTKSVPSKSFVIREMPQPRIKTDASQ